MGDDGASVEDYLEGADVRVRELLGQFSGRWFSISNRSQSADTVDPQVLKLFEAAASIARPTTLKPKEETRVFGRKTARRRRQMEAGLISGKREQLLRGLQPEQEESSGRRCMIL